MITEHDAFFYLSNLQLLNYGKRLEALRDISRHKIGKKKKKRLVSSYILVGSSSSYDHEPAEDSKRATH